MMKRLGKFIPRAPAEPKRCMWSRFHASAAAEHTAEYATVDDVPLIAAQHTSIRKNPWTRTHSHFALMGGFVFDADDSQVNFMPGTYTRITLGPRALLKLASVEPVLIPDISESDINDKSKASWLAKTLVCLQACWFIIQVTGRAATSAPISLLEMNTFLHALCCLVIYLAWWHKPLDIETPELIKTNTDKTRKICAWMIMNSKLGASGRIGNTGYRGCLIHNKDLYREDTSERAGRTFDLDDISRFERSSYSKKAQTEVPNEDAQPTSHKLYPGQMLHGFYYLINRSRIDSYKSRPTLDSATTECLRLANSLRTDPGAEEFWKFNWSSSGRVPPAESNMVLTHRSDFDFVDDDRLKDFKGSTRLTRTVGPQTFYLTLTFVAGSVYGLIHLIAWNGPFTSLVQRWMWRGSCLVVASPSVLLAVLFGIDEFYDRVRGKNWALVLFAPLWFPCKLIRKAFPYFSVQWKFAVYSISGLLALVYLAARVFLIVECFVNISQLPPEVYQIPQWSQYIPHLGGG